MIPDRGALRVLPPVLQFSLLSQDLLRVFPASETYAGSSCKGHRKVDALLRNQRVEQSKEYVLPFFLDNPGIPVAIAEINRCHMLSHSS